LVDTAGVTDGPASRDAQGAVFLSYASEDAPAAERICSALQAAGIEGLIHVPHDRYFTSLRDTPRFRALLQKLNLLT
jgi:hypothetical protein